MQPPAWSMRYTLCGRRSHSSPASGDGHRRLKNWPGLTARAFGDAATTRCLYSSLTESCDITGHRASSAGISDSIGGGSLLPTMNGADAKTSPIALDLAFKSCRSGAWGVNYTSTAAKSTIVDLCRCNDDESRPLSCPVVGDAENVPHHSSITQAVGPRGGQTGRPQGSPRSGTVGGHGSCAALRR